MNQPPQNHPLRNFFCGFLIGGGSILPGVSGGILALIFGIYRPLMDFLANPRRALRQHISLLLPVGLGIIFGFVTFAKVIAIALTGNNTITTWCFIGLIAGTFPSMERESRKEGRTKGCYISFALCGLIVLGSLLTVNVSTASQSQPGLALYALCGIILGLGSAVPGLSSSSLLMALGLYTPMMQAVSTLNWEALIAFVPWAVVTLLALARLVTWVFDHYFSISFHGVLGIVLASTLLIIPTTYTGLGELLLCALSAIGGFAIAWMMVRLDRP